MTLSHSLLFLSSPNVHGVHRKVLLHLTGLNAEFAQKVSDAGEVKGFGGCPIDDYI